MVAVAPPQSNVLTGKKGEAKHEEWAPPEDVGQLAANRRRDREHQQAAAEDPRVERDALPLAGDPCRATVTACVSQMTIVAIMRSGVRTWRARPGAIAPEEAPPHAATDSSAHPLDSPSQHHDATDLVIPAPRDALGQVHDPISLAPVPCGPRRPVTQGYAASPQAGALPQSRHHLVQCRRE